MLISFIISNIVTESFSNTALRESSHRISRLLDGFCKSLSLMYDQLVMKIVWGLGRDEKKKEGEGWWIGNVVKVGKGRVVARQERDATSRRRRTRNGGKYNPL